MSRTAHHVPWKHQTRRYVRNWTGWILDGPWSENTVTTLRYPKHAGSGDMPSEVTTYTVSYYYPRMAKAPVAEYAREDNRRSRHVANGRLRQMKNLSRDEVDEMAPASVQQRHSGRWLSY